MEISAQAKYIRMSPKKIRSICDVVRGMEVANAEAQLQFIKRRASGPVLKLLRSAIANAKHNYGLEKDNLFIKEIRADEGPTLHRWQPRAFGRATPRRKRSSHISIILSEIEKIKAKPVQREKLARPEIVEKPPKEEMEIKERPPAPRGLKEEKEEKKKPFDIRRKGKRRAKQHLDKVGLKRATGAVRRIFRRKAV